MSTRNFFRPPPRGIISPYWGFSPDMSQAPDFWDAVAGGIIHWTDGSATDPVRPEYWGHPEGTSQVVSGTIGNGAGTPGGGSSTVNHWRYGKDIGGGFFNDPTDVLRPTNADAPFSIELVYEIPVEANLDDGVVGLWSNAASSTQYQGVNCGLITVGGQEGRPELLIGDNATPGPGSRQNASWAINTSEIGPVHVIYAVDVATNDTGWLCHVNGVTQTIVPSNGTGSGAFYDTQTGNANSIRWCAVTRSGVPAFDGIMYAWNFIPGRAVDENEARDRAERFWLGYERRRPVRTFQALTRPNIPRVQPPIVVMT